MGRTLTTPDTQTYAGRCGARFRQRRLKAGYATQQALADALTAAGHPTTQRTVSGWESGANLPNVMHLATIASVLQISVHRLLPRD